MLTRQLYQQSVEANGVKYRNTEIANIPKYLQSYSVSKVDSCFTFKNNDSRLVSVLKHVKKGVLIAECVVQMVTGHFGP